MRDSIVKELRFDEVLDIIKKDELSAIICRDTRVLGAWAFALFKHAPEGNHGILLDFATKLDDKFNYEYISNPEANILLGNFFLKTPRYRNGITVNFQAAINEFSRGVISLPFPDNFNSLGMAYAGQARITKDTTLMDTAVFYGKMAISADSNKWEYHSNLAGYYSFLNNPASSIQSYMDAISVNPSAFQIYYELGYFYKNQGRFTDAINSFKTVIEFVPPDEEAVLHNQFVEASYFAIVTCYSMLGDVQGAINILQWAKLVGISFSKPKLLRNPNLSGISGDPAYVEFVQNEY